MNKSPCVYGFTCLVFGVNASPFLAQYVSQFHAQLFQQSHQRASEAILKSAYMDDGMDSVTEEIEGIKLYIEPSNLWRKAGMCTHKKFFCNFERNTMHDKTGQKDYRNSSITPKMLGVLWMAST